MKKTLLYYLLLFTMLCSCKEQESIPPLPSSITIEVSSISLANKTVELMGTEPANGITGSWTIENELEGFFSDESDPITTFKGGYFDKYVIRWTLTNGVESKFAEETILILSEASLLELVEVGISVETLIEQGYAPFDLFSVGITVSQLQSAGVSISELLTEGITVLELYESGILVGELKQSGAQDTELEESGLIGYMSDIENNVYEWVKIGESVWMAENLRTTQLRDGTPLAQITNDKCWSASGTYPPDYCEIPNNSIYGFRWMYNDSTSFASTYGALYSRNVILTGQLCPEGWHVPSIDDVNYLKQYSDNYPGGFKEIGTEHWQSPNEGANNFTGFSAQPAGKVDGFDGEFTGFGYQTYYWTSLSTKPAYFGFRNIESEMFFESENFVDEDSYRGSSCRCVKD